MKLAAAISALIILTGILLLGTNFAMLYRPPITSLLAIVLIAVFYVRQFALRGRIDVISALNVLGISLLFSYDFLVVFPWESPSEAGRLIIFGVGYFAFFGMVLLGITTTIKLLPRK